MSGLSLIPSSTVGNSPVATYMRNGLHVGVQQIEELIVFRIQNLIANTEKVVNLSEIDYQFMPLSGWMYYPSPTGNETLWLEVTTKGVVTGLLSIPASQIPYRFPPVILGKDNEVAMTASRACPLLIIYGKICAAVDERTW